MATSSRRRAALVPRSRETVDEAVPASARRRSRRGPGGGGAPPLQRARRTARLGVLALRTARMSNTVTVEPRRAKACAIRSYRPAPSTSSASGGRAVQASRGCGSHRLSPDRGTRARAGGEDPALRGEAAHPRPLRRDEARAASITSRPGAEAPGESGSMPRMKECTRSITSRSPRGRPARRSRTPWAAQGWSTEAERMSALEGRSRHSTRRPAGVLNQSRLRADTAEKPKHQPAVPPPIKRQVVALTDTPCSAGIVILTRITGSTGEPQDELS